MASRPMADPPPSRARRVPTPRPAGALRRGQAFTAVALLLLALVLVGTTAAVTWEWARITPNTARQPAAGAAAQLKASDAGQGAAEVAGARRRIAEAAAAGLALLLIVAAGLALQRRATGGAVDGNGTHPGSEAAVADSLIERLPAFVLQVDAAGVVTFVNRHWETATGLERRRFLGRRLTDLCQPGSRAHVDALLAARDGREVSPVLVRLLTSQGYLTLELSLTAVRGENGQAAGHAGFAVDVTGRQSARERLQDQLDFATRLLDISPTALFAKDMHHRYIEVNRAWLDLAGLPLNRVLGRTERSLFGDASGKIEASDRHVLDSGERVSYEDEFPAADGSLRDTLVTKARLTRGDGASAGIVGSVADVTAYRQAERATRAARDALVQAAKAKLEFERSFLSMAAHELRTPLTSLRLQGELIAGAPTPADRQRHTGELLASIDRIGHVLEQLMILSRVDGLRYTELDFVDIDLEATYFKVMSLLQDEAAERGMRMKASLRGGWLSGVEFGVYTMMRNLLHNAILYTPVGGKIAIAASKSAAGMLLTVDDSGPGIPAAQRDKAFDRFHRLGQQSVKGSGLGLSIVRTIAALHGASVELDTSPLGGLRVSVLFPSQAPTAPQFLDSGLQALNDQPHS